MKIEAVDIQTISGEQIIRLPNEWRINDDKVYLKKVGNVIYIIPYHTHWKSFFDSITEFSEDFMDERNELLHQTRESFE